jgi:hypothetical protein
MPVYATIITMKQPIKTMENLAVILQKICKTIVVTADFVRVIEGVLDLHISEFCDLNLKSILNKGGS